MTTLAEATRYFDVAATVLECIAVGLDDHIVIGTMGRPGRVLLAPGNEVPWDGCECGQLGIAFQHGPYPSLNFPAETTDGPGRCAVDVVAVRFSASLIRCQYHPSYTSDRPPKPPTQEQQTAATKLQQIEEVVVRDALICCLNELRRTYVISDFRIGSNDYQVNGACGEVSIVFWVSWV